MAPKFDQFWKSFAPASLAEKKKIRRTSTPSEQHTGFQRHYRQNFTRRQSNLEIAHCRDAIKRFPRDSRYVRFQNSNMHFIGSQQRQDKGKRPMEEPNSAPDFRACNKCSNSGLRWPTCRKCPTCSTCSKCGHVALHCST
jgi:hypothetical protein